MEKQSIERIPEEKLTFVIQIMQGINGLLDASEEEKISTIDLDQFIMSTTDRGRNADEYIREMRDAH